jgi:hypothetical protein
MRTIKIAGFILAGILAIVPPAAFGQRSGGGGGGHSSGGGHFGGGGHSSGGGHFGGGGHSAANHFAGNHFAFHGGGRYAPHFFRHGGYVYGYPFGYGDYAYDYSDGDDSGYSDSQDAPAEIAPFLSESIIISVQKELTQLGYYQGPIDGAIGPETEKAVRWFQSVDKLPVTGQVDSQTLQALGIS